MHSPLLQTAVWQKRLGTLPQQSLKESWLMFRSYKENSVKHKYSLKLLFRFVFRSFHFQMKFFSLQSVQFVRIEQACFKKSVCSSVGQSEVKSSSVSLIFAKIQEYHELTFKSVVEKVGGSSPSTRAKLSYLYGAGDIGCRFYNYYAVISQVLPAIIRKCCCRAFYRTYKVDNIYVL